jgi:hypothetical protein
VRAGSSIRRLDYLLHTSFIIVPAWLAIRILSISPKRYPGHGGAAIVRADAGSPLVADTRRDPAPQDNILQHQPRESADV